MPLAATLIADSLHPNGKDRLTTILIKSHRFCHAELCRHRAFSLSVSSSRAIKLERFLKWVEEDPAEPVEWGKEQPGMSAKAVLSPEDAEKARKIWMEARDNALNASKALAAVGAHKQLVNRIAEPWHFVSAVVTGDQRAWANFFALRCHKDAQPEICAAACAALRVYAESVPVRLEYGDWHTPFVSQDEKRNIFQDDACRFSAARTARTSYHNHDGTNPDPVKDLQLFERLVGQIPGHWSPTEHQARPRHKTDTQEGLGGNLGSAWVQFRKTFQQEFLTTIPDYAYEMAGVTKGLA